MRPSISILLRLLLLFFLVAINGSAEDKSPGPVRLKMSRRQDGELRVTSATSQGDAEYLVHFHVGTPPQEFKLVPDTGSDLTWLRCTCQGCKRRPHGEHGHHHGGVGSKHHPHHFEAAQSSSFTKIPCWSDFCNELPSLECPKNPNSTCSYDYKYLDQSSAQGFFANETVTLNLVNGGQFAIENVPIGCSKSSTGHSFDVADGILGLGLYKTSFAWSAMNAFGPRLAYCLVDHMSSSDISSYMVFGIHQYPELSNMQHTDFVFAGQGNTNYGVKVVGISIADKMLDIPMNVWEPNGDEGGTILDSGTSLTILAKPAYDLVMSRLKEPLMNLEMVEADPFEFCVDTKGYDDSMVPKLTFHFANSVRFEPPVKSYMISLEEDTKCLGFMPGDSNLTIIGNIMQQNYLWEFDFKNERVGFAPSTCV